MRRLWDIEADPAETPMTCDNFCCKSVFNEGSAKDQDARPENIPMVVRNQCDKMDQTTKGSEIVVATRTTVRGARVHRKKAPTPKATSFHVLAKMNWEAITAPTTNAVYARRENNDSAFCLEFGVDFIFF
jgi:hypothetical protein